MSEYKPVRAIESAMKERLSAVPNSVKANAPEIEFLFRRAFFDGAKFGNDFSLAMTVLPDALRRQMQNDFDQEVKDLDKLELGELKKILEQVLKRTASGNLKP